MARWLRNAVELAAEGAARLIGDRQLTEARRR
jgi:hypothetical protein